MIDLAKEIWQTMRTNKLRTFLTGFSVAWGIFMLILLLSIANGVMRSTMEMSSENDPYRITVWGGRTSMPYQGLKEGRSIDLRDRNRQAIKKANPNQISVVEGNISYKGTVSTQRNYSTESIEGCFPASFTGFYTLCQGRFINDVDINETRKVIVLHHKTAALLFSDTTKVIGQYVNVGPMAFKVIGTYDQAWDETNYIPYTTARALQGYTDELNDLQVHIPHVADETQSADLEEQVIGALAQDLHFNPADKSAVYTYDRFASYIQTIKATNILNYAMWIIGILTLITGIVGVSNIMFVSVRERSHEIGIRRAIGAKPRSILVQVVLESVALTTLFGYIGIVMGVAATEGVKWYFAGADMPFTPQVDIKIAFEVTVALIIAGALAGIFPAMRSTKVKPVEALRDE